MRNWLLAARPRDFEPPAENIDLNWDRSRKLAAVQKLYSEPLPAPEMKHSLLSSAPCISDIEANLRARSPDT